MPKRFKNPQKLFDKQNKKINNKFPFLILLEYGGYKKGISKFNDLVYGDFYGNYRSVFRRHKQHEDRSRIEKQILRKQTNIKIYGFDHPMKNSDIIQKTKNTLIKLNKRKTVNGLVLHDFFKTLEISNHIKYARFYHTYIKYGEVAFNKDIYEKIWSRSKIANEWLNIIEYSLDYSIIREYHIKGTKFRVDGFDPKTNTIYEFYGDVWHGNPKRYNLDDIQAFEKKTYRYLYDKTMKREAKLKSLGYNIITIWETDYNSLLK